MFMHASTMQACACLTIQLDHLSSNFSFLVTLSLLHTSLTSSHHIISSAVAVNNQTAHTSKFVNTIGIIITNTIHKRYVVAG